MTPSVYSGARVTLSIGGTPVSAGFVMDWSLSTEATPLETIDNVFAVELMPTRISVSMNIRVYRHPDNDPVMDGIAPGSASLGSAEQRAFLQTPYIYIEIKDDLDNTILVIPKAMIVRRSASVSSGDFMTENWSIRGLSFFGPNT